MKNIVICCDGTRSKYDSQEQNTNVVRLFQRLAQDGPEQISFYDPGVGTYSPLRSGIWRRIEAAVESASGSGVPSKVAEAYKYLMDHYEPDDRVFLFGYSRGAHTVRDLSGLLYSCGLLTKGSDNLIPYALDFYYRDDTPDNSQIASHFRDTFSRQCKVHFIGVWDTVASVGWLWWRRYFRNDRLSPEVSFAYQALALDERRAHYRPSQWDEEAVSEDQMVQQVWFPGSHGDVGGQNADRRISDVPLLWMIVAAEQQKLRLNSTWQVGLEPSGEEGEVRRSDRHFFRFRASPRSIPRSAKVHQSAQDRLTAGNGYSPGCWPEHPVFVT